MESVLNAHVQLVSALKDDIEGIKSYFKDNIPDIPDEIVDNMESFAQAMSILWNWVSEKTKSEEYGNDEHVEEVNRWMKQCKKLHEDTRKFMLPYKDDNESLNWLGKPSTETLKTREKVYDIDGCEDMPPNPSPHVYPINQQLKKNALANTMDQSAMYVMYRARQVVGMALVMDSMMREGEYDDDDVSAFVTDVMLEGQAIYSRMHETHTTGVLAGLRLHEAADMMKGDATRIEDGAPITSPLPDTVQTKIRAEIQRRSKYDRGGRGRGRYGRGGYGYRGRRDNRFSHQGRHHNRGGRDQYSSNHGQYNRQDRTDYRQDYQGSKDYQSKEKRN